MFGISNIWSMSHSSQRISKPAYCIVDCRISTLILKLKGAWSLHSELWKRNSGFLQLVKIQNSIERIEVAQGTSIFGLAQWYNYIGHTKTNSKVNLYFFIEICNLNTDNTVI